MIIADTNVVSDFMRDQPDAMVLAWAQGIAPADLAICVVTVEEIVAAAREAAAVLVAAQASGRPMSLADAQIAGICLAGGYDLATRNVGDFASASGLTLINPFP